MKYKVQKNNQRIRKPFPLDALAWRMIDLGVEWFVRNCFNNGNTVLVSSNMYPLFVLENVKNNLIRLFKGKSIITNSTVLTQLKKFEATIKRNRPSTRSNPSKKWKILKLLQETRYKKHLSVLITLEGLQTPCVHMCTWRCAKVNRTLSCTYKLCISNTMHGIIPIEHFKVSQ